MKLPPHSHSIASRWRALLPLGIALMLSSGCSPKAVKAERQDNSGAAEKTAAQNRTLAAAPAQTNAARRANSTSDVSSTKSNLRPTNSAAVLTNAAPQGTKPETNSSPQASKSETNSVVQKGPDGASPLTQGISIAGKMERAAGTNASSPAAVSSEKISSADDIPLSFQGANVDTVAQWLAKATGKSVVKHPKVQCQLTIISSKNLTKREAVTLVYRALALEGFTTIESSKSILIVPEGQEPKLSPELLEAPGGKLPEGRQRLIKIFPLEHVSPSEIKEKVRGVLSEKGTIDSDDHGNKVIVTDYTDNIRLVGELIQELDVVSATDSVIEIYTLKHAEAEDLANLMSLIMNSQAAPPGAPGAPGAPMPGAPGGPMPGGPMKDGRPPGGPGGPMPGAPGGPMPGGVPGQPAAAGQIRFWSDKTSNRLIVATPKSKLPEIQRLLNILDSEKPQDVSVRVIPLKNVSAEDLVREIGPLYQKVGGKSLKETIEVTANTRSNSLIVLSSEANFKALEKLIVSLDTEEAQEKAMRAFPLKNADAEDVAKQLQDLSQDQDRSSPYIFFYPFSSNRSAKKLSVVADRRRNTVIVQAPPGAMENLAKMIKELDEPVTDNNLAPKIFQLKYVSATDIEDVLNELFLKKQQQRSYWDFYEGFGDTANRDVGRLYGKVRITSEPYSNSIIVTSNSPEHLAAVEDVLKQLDVPSPAGDTTLRVSLKFAKATTVANSMNILFAKGGSPALRQTPQPGQPGEVRPQQQGGPSDSNNFELEQEAKEDQYYPWLGGQQESGFGYRSSDSRSATRPVSDLVGRVRVVADKRTNSLLITSNVHFFPQVLKLLNDLDAPTAQVLIGAKIIEVSSDFRDKLGVRWSPDGNRTFDAEDLDNSIKINGASTYKKYYSGSALANSLHSGILDASVNLDILIQVLRKNTDASVLAEPQINIADNEMGRLFVGARVPFISGSIINTGFGGRNDTFQYKDVGVILEVTPHINNAAEVALKIRAESSNIRNGETLFGGAILDTRNFRTDLMVKSGQTVVLGGIIQRENVNTIRKVPLLGSIPVLGWAFKKKDKIARDVELMVFLQTRVTRTPEEASQLLQDVEKKAPKIEQWEKKKE